MNSHVTVAYLFVFIFSSTTSIWTFSLVCLYETAIMHNLLTISARIWFQLNCTAQTNVSSALLKYSWGSQVIQGLYHLALAVHLCLELCLLFLLCYYSYLGPVSFSSCVCHLRDPSQAVILTSWTRVSSLSWC